MGAACLLSFVFPAIGLLVLLLSSQEGFEPDTSYLGWFVIGGVAQVVAALMFLRPKSTGWKRGWVLLWLASAAYMGGYSDVWLQKKPVSAQIMTFAKAGDTDAMQAAMVQENGFTLLEWTFAVLFVAAFFTIAAFVTKRMRDAYGMTDPDLEDPLAFKQEYGIS